MASDIAEAPAGEPAESMTHADIDQVISSSVPESDLKYLDETPEKAEKPEKTTKKPEKKEIGDSEIPLDDDEPEKVVDEEEEDEQPPAAKTETDRAKADAKWKQYREAYKENPRLRSENQDLKRQLEAAKDTTEIGKLREAVQSLYDERQRLVQLVEMGNVEQSEVWQQQVMQPLTEMWGDIQDVAKRNGMDAMKLAKLIQSGDDMVLNDYMEEHTTRPGDRNFLFNLIPQVKGIERRKEYLREHAHELGQQNRQQLMSRRDEYIRGVSGQRAHAIEVIVPKIEQKILSVLPKDKRRNLQNDVKHILDFENWDEDVKMFGGVAAVVLPDLLDSYNLLRGQLRDAKQELLKLRGGGPRLSPSGRSASTPPARHAEEEEPTGEDLAKTNLADFAEESTKRIRQAMGFRK